MLGFITLSAVRAERAARDRMVLRIIGAHRAQGITLETLTRNTGYSRSQVEASLRRLQNSDEKALVRGCVRQKRQGVRWKITSAGREVLDNED